jgi:hypothetical protein
MLEFICDLGFVIWNFSPIYLNDTFRAYPGAHGAAGAFTSRKDGGSYAL